MNLMMLSAALENLDSHETADAAEGVPRRSSPIRTLRRHAERFTMERSRERWTRDVLEGMGVPSAVVDLAIVYIVARERFGLRRGTSVAEVACAIMSEELGSEHVCDCARAH